MRHSAVSMDRNETGLVRRADESAYRQHPSNDSVAHGRTRGRCAGASRRRPPGSRPVHPAILSPIARWPPDDRPASGERQAREQCGPSIDTRASVKTRRSPIEWRNRPAKNAAAVSAAHRIPSLERRRRECVHRLHVTVPIPILGRAPFCRQQLVSRGPAGAGCLGQDRVEGIRGPRRA